MNNKKGKNKSNNQRTTKGASRKHKRLSTNIVLTYLSQRQEPANTKAIAETLGRVGKEGRQETFDILEQLRDEGKVSQLSKHRWAMKHAIKEHQGRVVGHVDGHGYVLTDETKEKVFLRSHDMREVLHNDVVMVRITGRDKRKKLFGQIIDVVERGNTLVVGRFYQESNLNFVVPDDQRIGQDIFVLPEHTLSAKPGEVVTVRITKPPSKYSQPVGEVAEVLGEYSAPGMEIEIAIRKHQLPHVWPEAVESQIKKLNPEVSDNDLKGRKDLRDLALVTIDGEDARDFDDAVYCEPAKSGLTRLIVAIADVSHYVKTQSPLDLEAWQRGTSVYFPNNVIPMLPEVLSNGLCSLNPKVDRLCMACDMQITSEGEVASYDFYPAVMHSQARLTYTQVSALIEGDTESANISADLHENVHALYQLSKKLGKARRKFGAIEFEIPEPVILFDENRKIDKVVARQRNDAHRLIEECMLVANICASLMLDESKLAGIYRVHESPDEDKIEDVRVFLRQFKLLLEGGDQPTPAHYSKVINKVTDPQISKIVQSALLRSMKQARYHIENEGHFALNFDSYTHFTSPIRRYSDLHVHRQIKRKVLDSNAEDDETVAIQVEQTAEQASMTERRAETATREAVQWLKCEYMSHRLGETLKGVVTTVTDFGLFVELEEVYVDGLIHITSLGQDYYRFDADRRQLVGEDSGRVFKTGDQLQVQVARVDMEQGRIDFSLPEVGNKKFSKRGKGNIANKSSQSSKGKRHNNQKRKLRSKN